MEVNGIIEVDGDQEQKWKTRDMWRENLYRIPCGRSAYHREMCFMYKYKKKRKLWHLSLLYFVRFEVLMAVNVKVMDIWNVTPQSVLDRCCCYRRTLAFFFCFEHGRNMFLHSVGAYLPCYIMSHPKDHKLNIHLLNTLIKLFANLLSAYYCFLFGFSYDCQSDLWCYRYTAVWLLNSRGPARPMCCHCWPNFMTTLCKTNCNSYIDACTQML
jgi:hypothetical protein